MIWEDVTKGFVGLAAKKLNRVMDSKKDPVEMGLTIFEAIQETTNKDININNYIIMSFLEIAVKSSGNKLDDRMLFYMKAYLNNNGFINILKEMLKYKK